MQNSLPAPRGAAANVFDLSNMGVVCVESSGLPGLLTLLAAEA